MFKQTFLPSAKRRRDGCLKRGVDDLIARLDKRANLVGSR